MKLNVSGAGTRSRTPRDLLLRFGRAVLWAAVAVVLVRGAAGVFSTEPRAASSRVVRIVEDWPDESARAFAAEFATAYLTLDPREGTSSRGRLGELAAPEVVDSLAPTLDADAPRQTVGSVTVERAARLDDEHALITVATNLNGSRSRTVRLTVPVARDAHGGLVVNDLPSMAATPRRAAAQPASGASLLGDERAAIEDVLKRFLRAFLSGDRAGLAYLAPPGAQVAATSGGFELLEVGSLTCIGPTTGRERVVLVTAHVRDRASRATYALRYRVRLVRRDRWYVAAINDLTGAGRVR